MTVKERIGQRIRLLREQKELTQDHLAKLAKISGKHLGEIERGSSNVTIDSLDAIAHALKVDLASLFFFKSTDERPDKDTLIRLVKSIDDEQSHLVFQFLVSVANKRRENQ